ncbi:MAG: hypothetical protein NZ822_00195 [Patescibacteria group bacterium]|nr:hypothetical protein [Patescibacteria group bacterium]
MNNLKVNYYLLAIFLILLLLNIYLYFFGEGFLGELLFDKKQASAQQNLCEGFSQSNCPGAENCEGVTPGPGDDMVIESMIVRTFACNTTSSDWDSEPWRTALRDNMPSTTVSLPTTGEGPCWTVSECEAATSVTNIGEPIQVAIRASSSQGVTLKVEFINNYSSTANFNLSTTTSSGKRDYYFNYTISTTTSNIRQERNIAMWEIKASLCRNNNCTSQTSARLRVNKYDCRGSNCTVSYRSGQSVVSADCDGKFCEFWINKFCGIQ